MPNHVCNALTVTGANDEQIQRIVQAATADRLGAEFMPEPDWQATPNEDGVLPGPIYFDRHTSWRKWQGGSLTTRGRRFPNGDYDQRWYGWCVTNWGTKWGSYDCEVSVEAGTVNIFYTTAWSPFDDGFFEEMSAQMPEATIVNTFQEPGCDFYGVQLARNGECNSRCKDISALKEDWIKRNVEAPKVLIYENEDHEEHDDVRDLIDDLWWDASDEVINEACEELGAEIEDSFSPSSHKLKGRALIDMRNKLLKQNPDTAVDEIAKACGYTDLKEFAAAIFGTHEGMENVEMTLKILKSK